MTILHGDDPLYNNIFVQKWPSFARWLFNDSEVKTDLENREVGTHVMDEYPTHDEWIKKFDMDTDTPDMKKLETAHFQHLPVWGKGRIFSTAQKAYRNETDHLVDTRNCAPR